jgi:hypothetical protein
LIDRSWMIVNVLARNGQASSISSAAWSLAWNPLEHVHPCSPYFSLFSCRSQSFKAWETILIYLQYT